MSNADAREAIRFLLDLWKAAEVAGLDPAAVCNAFLAGGKAGVEAYYLKEV